MAPGAADRAGFGSAALREKYPSLITVDISGYGHPESAGLYWDMKAYDMLIQAESGISTLTGKPGWPTRVGVSVADIACGMFCHASVLEALLERKRTGKGVSIDTSLFSALADWMSVPLMHWEADGKGPSIGNGLRHPSVQPYAAYETQGAPVLISIQNEREFASLCEKVLERPDLPKDEKFCSNVARCSNSAALDEIIKASFLSMDRTALIDKLRTHRIAYGEVNDMEGFSKHPALTRVPVELPDGSKVQAVAPPAQFDGKPAQLRPVPGYAQHDEQIRKEFA
mmetsp:Transcript_25308/g.53766  ORF Transcript_25308/g.53766 Transcript_25308/m.53766 type:complete len:284 (-) Transcript_25308:300-1151(-)